MPLGSPVVLRLTRHATASALERVEVRASLHLADDREVHVVLPIGLLHGLAEEVEHGLLLLADRVEERAATVFLLLLQICS